LSGGAASQFFDLVEETHEIPQCVAAHYQAL
jgi:hypothetical protein